jgi:glycosyltransferase involved in cell wall biosynthesis
MVCRLYIPRDFETLLQALSAARSTVPDLHLAIVGDGPMRNEIAARAAALGLAEHVTLAGWRTDTPAIYAASDIYALTTWGWEGLPISVMEAMACGCPAVATGAGGTPELIAHGETGYVVAPRSVEDLAAAFRVLGGNSALRRAMGEAGRRRVEQHFTEQGMVAKVAALYDRVLAERRA